MLLRQLLIWTAICGVSAAPSFILALIEYSKPSQVLAMLAGIGCFIGGYTLISCMPWMRRFRRRPFVMTTLKIGYGTRIGISVLSLVPPIAIADMYIGLISLGIADVAFDLTDGTTTMIFITTLVTGTLWNIALAIYMLIVHGLQLLTRQKPPPETNMCAECGYDLRASTGVCPECGLAIPSHSGRG